MKNLTKDKRCFLETHLQNLVSSLKSNNPVIIEYFLKNIIKKYMLAYNNIHASRVILNKECNHYDIEVIIYYDNTEFKTRLIKTIKETE